MMRARRKEKREREEEGYLSVALRAWRRATAWN